MKLQNVNRLLVLLTVILIPGLAAGLASDREQPIYIEADKVSVDDKKGISTYRGNVSITQGSMHLKADSAVVYNSDKGLQKVVVVGKPARFRQRPDNELQDIHAEALRMEYLSNKERLYLLKRAKLRKGANLFTGNRIVYDTRTHVVTGKSSPDNPKQRVRITLEPKKK